MKLCKHAGYRLYNIVEPRWHDKRVLLAAHKVRNHNVIKFKSKMLPDLYYLSGATIKSFSKQSNGSIDCYAVPLDRLEAFDYLEHCEHEL